MVERQRTKKQSDINVALKVVETQTIREALKRNNNNRAATAQELGIHKSTLFRKMKSLGIPLPQEDGRSRPKDRRNAEA